jgi:WD40 repeat protein
LATLWVDDNPIEFPPPPIPNLGFKRIFEWLRKSDASCAQRDPVTNSKGSDSSKFERIQSTSTTISRLSRTSSDPKRTSSDVEAARFERENAQGQGGAKSQRNELWIKIARRRFADSEEEGIAETKVREQCRLFRHGQQVHDMNFHPDLPIFASCSEDRTVKIWEQNPVRKCIFLFVFLVLGARMMNSLILIQGAS